MKLFKRSQFILLALVIAATLVAGSACGGSNHPPVITSLTPNPAAVLPGGDSTITCVADDADSDQLTYTWSGTGAIIGSGNSVVFTAPSTPEHTPSASSSAMVKAERTRAARLSPFRHPSQPDR